MNYKSNKIVMITVVVIIIIVIIIITTTIIMAIRVDSKIIRTRRIMMEINVL